MGAGDDRAPTGRDPNVHAAIDVGTNSFHLVVARVAESGRFDVITQEKDRVRLGSGSGDMKLLTADAIERGLATLRRYRQVAEIWTDDISVVATSAVREADNQDEFVRRAAEEAGVAVDVISGVEEARLIRLGVLQAVPVFARRHLIVDIGGGSTEFVLGDGDTVRVARSLKLGAVRLTDRFFATGRITDDDVDACRRHLRSYLSPVVRDVADHGFDVAVGSSGTIENLTQMAVALRTGETPDSVNAMTLTRADLDKVVDTVLGAASTKDRRQIAGLDPRRADIIVAGALLLQQVFTELEVDEMTASEFALREGVLLDRVESDRPANGHQLSNPRRSSVAHVAAQFDPHPRHSAHATELALSLFDQTASVHGLGDAERDLLESAGLLHNVGLLISHSSHHHHSYYVIRNAELTGFTQHEVELMAQVARYHRKSGPKTKHPEFAALSLHDRLVVRVLAGLLRVGIALDRAHSAAVGSVDADVDRQLGSLLVRLHPADGVAPTQLDLQLYTARERSDLLADALDLTVEFEVADA